MTLNAESQTYRPANSVFGLVTLVLATLNCQNLLAQAVADDAWHSRVQKRFQAIYERGDFRPKVFQPTWLADSTGLTVRVVDPDTQQETLEFYEVSTGSRASTNWEEIEAKKRDIEGSAKPALKLEARDGKLLVIDREHASEVIIASAPADRDVQFRSYSLSPNGAKVLFVEADYTDVRQRAVLVPGDPSYPDVRQNRFARIGGTIEKLRVGVVNADGTEPNWLPIDAPPEGFYLGQVEWAGDSNTVLIEKFSRARDSRDCLLVSTTDGRIETIFSETDPAWVESSQGKNSGIVWIRGGQAFVVISEKDGWRHAYIYSRSGVELTKLTPGEFDIIDRATIDEAQGWCYYYASPDDGTQKYLYRVKLDGTGQSEQVTPADQIGTHNYQFSPDAKWAIHTYSTIDSPPRHELIEVSGHRVVKLLEDNASLRERMQAVNVQPTEFLKLDIGSGIILDAWMIRPKDFQPTKRYPVFVYVYGEPHAQTVLNEWGVAQIDFHRVVAEQGYVVVSIDNRGTPCPKGAAWRRSIFGSLGPLSTEEQVAGLQALAKQCPFVDLERVGIWGWSGGGSNTLNALFRKPESYHVGIAVVPKPQPHLYNAWFQEIFMRTPTVNPEGYERSAPINFADGLKGKLLIITGSGETNTHIQIIEGLVDKLIALGKPFDYMVYPNRDHGLREGEGTTVHVRMLILRYLMEHLAPGPR